MSRDTPHGAKECCRAIRALMLPTVQQAQADSIAVMLPRRLFDEIYALAGAGSGNAAGYEYCSICDDRHYGGNKFHAKRKRASK